MVACFLHCCLVFIDEDCTESDSNAETATSNYNDDVDDSDSDGEETWIAIEDNKCK